MLVGVAIVALLVPVTNVSAGGLTIASGDGVGLTLGADATVGGLRVGTRDLGMVGNGGFSVRNVGGMPQLLPNASFERDTDANGVPDGWARVARSVVPTIDSTVAHSGGRSVRIHLDTLGDSGYLSMDIKAKPNTDYTVSAWMRSDGVRPNAPIALTYGELSPVRVLVQQIVGTNTVRTAGTIFGYTDTADWNRQFLGIHTAPDASKIRVRVQLAHGMGTAWFDDLAVAELFRPGRVPIHGNVSTGGAGELLQHADLPAEQLTFDARYRASADRITVDGTISSTATTDRPLQVQWLLPFDAIGWSWHDNARSSHLIEAGKSYAYDTRWNTQSMSRYPWSTLSDAASSLSIGIPLSMPRIARVRYAPRGLSITFDLGLSPDATGLGNAATFRFVLFTSAPAWGFRASTAKYYALYPGSFVRRTDPAREGGWVQRKYLGVWADQMADFGLGFDMLALGSDQDGADNNDAYLLEPDNAEGIYASGYTHEWGYKYQLPSHESTPSYEEALGLLEAAAAGPTSTEKERRAADKAKGTLASAAVDYNGRLVYERYGDRFLQWYLNLDPLPAAEMDAARAGHEHQLVNAIDNAEAVDGTLDGIHFDSTSGMRRWGAQDDYSRAHWAVALEPLTFSWDSGLVAVRISLTDFGQIEREADFLHGRGMILTANFNGSEARAGAWFGADKIDYFGIEQGLPEKSGEGDIYVTQDGFALYKRTLANQRPVTTLDPLLGAGLLSTAEVERRLKLNLFYGIYAGVGGKAGALTEEIRQLYLHYVPIFRAIDTAGWQPVTLATANDPAVWLERYGSLADGTLYLAIRNETTVARAYTVRVDLRGAGAPAVALDGLEMVTGAPVAVSVGPKGNRATFTGTLEPQGTHVVRITRTP